VEGPDSATEEQAVSYVEDHGDADRGHQGDQGLALRPAKTYPVCNAVSFGSRSAALTCHSSASVA
jgi:hypothetical protein